jgi:hypothetical protein
LFQTIKPNDAAFDKINKYQGQTAEDGVLEHIHEESLQKNTIQTNQSRKQTTFQTMKVNNFSRQSRPKKNRQFFTGEGLLGLKFNTKIKNENFTFTKENKNDSEPVKAKQFYTKGPSKRDYLLEDNENIETEKLKTQSISVTNNEITNNNHNVSINNKMNTFIIIMNDKKQQEELSKQFNSKKQDNFVSNEKQNLIKNDFLKNENKISKIFIKFSLKKIILKDLNNVLSFINSLDESSNEPKEKEVEVKKEEKKTISVEEETFESPSKVNQDQTLKSDEIAHVVINGVRTISTFF